MAYFLLPFIWNASEEIILNYFNALIRKKLKKSGVLFSSNKIINKATKIYASCQIIYPAYCPYPFKTMGVPAAAWKE